MPDGVINILIIRKPDLDEANHGVYIKKELQSWNTNEQGYLRLEKRWKKCRRKFPSAQNSSIWTLEIPAPGNML